MGISFSNCWLVSSVTEQLFCIGKSWFHCYCCCTHVAQSLMICRLARSPREPDSLLPHTSCNHLHQCRVSAKHYHTTASRDLWLRSHFTALFHQIDQGRIRLKSFREGLRVCSHSTLVCTGTALVHLLSFDSRMLSDCPAGKEISLWASTGGWKRYPPFAGWQEAPGDPPGVPGPFHAKFPPGGARPSPRAPLALPVGFLGTRMAY